jgi:hypothetical protein
MPLCVSDMPLCVSEIVIKILYGISTKALNMLEGYFPNDCRFVSKSVDRLEVTEVEEEEEDSIQGTTPHHNDDNVE